MLDKIEKYLVKIFGVTWAALLIKVRFLLYAGVVAVFGYLMPPVKSYIFHKVYNEEVGHSR